MKKPDNKNTDYSKQIDRLYAENRKLKKDLNQHAAYYRIKVKSEIVVSYQFTGNRPVVNSSSIAHQLFSDTWQFIERKESIRVMFLSKSNKVVEILTSTIGEVSGTVCDIREIVAQGCILNSTGIIMAHNHPSGNINPSDHDVKLTETLFKALDLVNIKLLDHLILSPDGQYLSFTDQGLM